jgi:iron complex outermembrane receptor protein
MNIPIYASRVTPIAIFCYLLSLTNAAAQSGAPVEPLSQNNPAPGSQGNTVAKREETSLEEIIVTASKRAESLQSVPAAVSAVTAEDLAALGANDLEGYARTIPGISFTDLGTGRQQVAIRGLNPTAGAPTVSFYIDETPIPGEQGGIIRVQSNPNLADIDRIEVLRGPQGTLYGSSSMGGTIKLITTPVDLNKSSGYVDVGGSSRGEDSWGDTGTLVGNLPIMPGMLGARAVLWYRTDDGFIDRRWGPNRLVDPTEFQGTQSNVGNQTVKGGRLSVLFEPSDILNVSGLVFHEDRSSNGLGDYTGGQLNPTESLNQIELANVAEPSSANFTLSNITAKLTLGNVNLTSSTSYYRSKTFLSEEGTAFIDYTFGILFPNRFDEYHSDRNVTQELRLATVEPIGGFSAIGGVYYNNDKNEQIYTYPVPGWNAEFAPTGPDDPSGLYTVNDNLAYTVTHGFQRETSEFGELSFAVNEKLKLTVGTRHYDFANVYNNATQGFFYDNVAGDSNAPGDFSGFLYKGNVSYQLTPDHLLYAQYSEGFRAGFGIVPVPSICSSELETLGLSAATNKVDPDNDKNYEIGAKTTWLDRRLLVNLALYEIKWNNIQQQLFLNCGFYLDANAGHAESRGVELEVEGKITEHLGGGLSAAYDKATLSQNEPTFGALAGDQINDVPVSQGAIHADYSFPILHTIQSVARVDAQYTGGSYADYVRLPGTDERDPAQRLQPLTLLNARLTFTRGDFSAALFGDNLFDKIVREDVQGSLIAQVPGRPRYAPNIPRTIGIHIHRAF